MDISPYLAFALLLTAAMLQTTIVHSLSLWGVAPDLMLMVIVAWGMLRGSRQGIPWALAGGLMLDLLSGGPFGVATVSLVVSSLVSSLGELNIFRGSWALPLTVSILATLVYDLVYLAVLRIGGRTIPLAASLVQVVAPGMVVNSLAMYPTVWAMRWLDRRTTFEKAQW